jgi:glycosyltransferase involved in cell wall biosynthesis
MSALVSVVIAAYDGERFLAETLDSVLAQDHDAVEVIVVDDGSTDGTAGVLSHYAERVTVIRQENAGVSAARNRGAEEARGELIAFLDQDDVWETGMLSTQVHYLERHPDSALVYADSWVIDAMGKVRGRRSSYLRYLEGDIFDDLLQRGNFIPIETSLMRTAVFRELGGFHVSLRYLEDFDLFLRIARGHSIGCQTAVLAKYRVHDKNLSHQREALLAEWIPILDALGSADGGLRLDEREAVERLRAQRCAEMAWHALRRADLPASDEWMARAGSRCPRGWRWRVRAPRALLGPLPTPWLRRIMACLPRGRLYGVTRPD